MIRIAIVDDDNTVCANIERYILDYSKTNQIELDVEVFENGEAFFDFWHLDHQFDLIFLDIELYEMNGIEVGRVLRKAEQNHHVQILYISANDTYAMELFHNRPFDFIVKPITKERITLALNEYLAEFPQEQSFFEYVRDRKKQRMLINKIIYIQSNRKKLIIATVDGTFEIYGKLDEILEEQLSSYFVRIHRCYAVNVQHITELSYEDVVLTNNEKFSISRPLQKQVREQLILLEHNKILTRAEMMK